MWEVDWHAIQLATRDCQELVQLQLWCPVDIREYEQWSHDQDRACACVYEREFEVGLCVVRVIDLSGLQEYYSNNNSINNNNKASYLQEHMLPKLTIEPLPALSWE